MSGKKQGGSVVGQKATGARMMAKQIKKQPEATAFAKGTRNIKDMFAAGRSEARSDGLVGGIAPETAGVLKTHTEQAPEVRMLVSFLSIVDALSDS